MPDKAGEVSVAKHGLLFHSVSVTSVHAKGLDASQEEPKKPQKYTSSQWLTIVTLAFGNFCIGACVSLQAPFFPKEAEKKGATPTEYGFIFGVYQLTIFLTAPLMGKLISYVPPKFLLNTGIFTVGVTCVLFGTLDMVPDRVSFVTLAFLVRIVEGVGAAALRTSSYTIIAATFSDKMATTFALLETFLGLGLITGPTLGGALYDLGGYGLPFYVIGALVLVDAVVLFFALPQPERPKNEGKGNVLKFWLNPGIAVYVFVIFTSFNYIGYNQVTLEPHLRRYKLSGVYLGLMFALTGSLYALTAPAWGWLCDKKWNNKVLSILGCLIMIASLLLIGPMPFLGLPSRLGITIASLALMGLALGGKLVSAFSGSLQDTLARGFPSDLTTYGLISSMYASSQSLGAFVGPSLGGYLFDALGYDSGTLVLLGLEIILVFVLLIYSLTRRWRKVPEKQPIITRNVRSKSYT